MKANNNTSRYKKVRQVQVLITPEQDKQLNQIAEQNAVSRSALVRTALGEFLERRLQGAVTR